MEGEKQVEASSPTKRRNSIGCEDFTIKHRLGRGAYGDVFLVLKNSDGKAFAMKQIAKKKLSREQKQYQAMIQKQLLTCFKHKGIVTLKYAFQDTKMLYFIQEYCECGQFTNFIKNNITKLTEQSKIFYIAQIVNILEYLHINGVTHRDLKPQNLMLDRRGHLKLIDFGTAEITNCKLLTPQFKQHILKLKSKSDEIQNSIQKVEDEEIQEQSPLKKRRSTFVGTCYYISPELLEHNYCPASADLWALGCIIYQLYYLETPFKDSYEFAVFQKIKKAEVSYPKNESVTPEAIDLIKRLLVKNPEQRLGSGTTEQLSYARLKAHPYFKGLDIDNIFNTNVPYIEGLQEVQRNEQDLKDAQKEFKSFSQQIENILSEITADGVEIIKYAVVEEKCFVSYIYVFLGLAKGGQLHHLTAAEPTVRQTLTLTQKSDLFCRLTTADKFEFQADKKTYVIRTASAEQWVKAINKQLAVQ